MKQVSALWRQLRFVQDEQNKALEDLKMFRQQDNDFRQEVTTLLSRLEDRLLKLKVEEEESLKNGIQAISDIELRCFRAHLAIQKLRENVEQHKDKRIRIEFPDLQRLEHEMSKLQSSCDKGDESKG